MTLRRIFRPFVLAAPRSPVGIKANSVEGRCCEKVAHNPARERLVGLSVLKITLFNENIIAKMAWIGGFSCEK